MRKTLILLLVCHGYYNIFLMAHIESPHPRTYGPVLHCVNSYSASHEIDAQWEGMGDVGSARYEPALLPPCPRRVLSYSN